MENIYDKEYALFMEEALQSMIHMPMVIEVNPVQLEKALLPIVVTLSGMVIPVSFSHCRKALIPMLVTESGIV